MSNASFVGPIEIGKAYVRRDHSVAMCDSFLRYGNGNVYGANFTKGDAVWNEPGLYGRCNRNKESSQDIVAVFTATSDNLNELL